MDKKLILLVLFAILGCFMVGCASMTTGSSEGDQGPNKLRKSPCAELNGGPGHA